MTATEVPIVLVVDDDERARRLVRMGLELEGLAVVEAESLRRARAVLHRHMSAVVLDRQLPDGDGLELLAEIGIVCPEATVVVNSTFADGREPSWIAKVDKGDLPAIVRALDLDLSGRDGAPDTPLAVVDLVREEAESVVRDWQELCRWDPLLPPDSSPPLARLVVDAVAEALRRPQPLGWGPDPALQQVTEMFAASAGGIDVAIGHLVCLREVFRRTIAGHVPPDEEAETRARVDMIVDRAIWTVSRVAAARMERQLSFDAATGLPNRAAFDRDLERELNRALRYARPLSIAVAVIEPLDVDASADGDTGGPAEPGDEVEPEFAEAAEAQVRRVAAVLATNVRAQDVAYRTGPARFGLLLPETDEEGAEALLERLRTAPVPGLSVGAATFPAAGDDAVSLLHEADRRRARTLAG